MRNTVAMVLQCAGVIALASAGFLLHVTLGLTVLGVGLVLFGLAVERG